VREGLYGATVKDFFSEKITLSTDLCGINCGLFSGLLCLFFKVTGWNIEQTVNGSIWKHYRQEMNML
jgi:hypothetical protein